MEKKTAILIILGDFIVGFVTGSIEEFRKASEGSLKHVGSRYQLGHVLLYDKKDIRGAMRAWENYLRLEPEGKRADWVRGRLEQLKTGAR